MKTSHILFKTLIIISCALFISTASCSEDDKDSCTPSKCEQRTNQTASCLDNSCHYTCNDGFEMKGNSCEPVKTHASITSCAAYGDQNLILNKDEKKCVGNDVVICTIDNDTKEAPQATILETCSDKGSDFICDSEQTACVENANKPCSLGDGEQATKLDHGKNSCLNGNVVTCHNGSIETETCTNGDICLEKDNDFICQTPEPKDCTLDEGTEIKTISDGTYICDGDTIKICRSGSFVTTTECTSDTPHCNPGDGTEAHPVKCEAYKCEANESYCETDKQNHAIRVTCMMGNLLTGKSEDATTDCTEKELFCTVDEWGGYCAPCLENDISLCTNDIPQNATRACVSDGYSLFCGFTCNDGYKQDENACVKE